MATDFILASTSPRRRELLRQAGFSFEIVAPPADDDPAANGHLPPGEVAATLAREKAESAAEIRPGRVVLAADTIVVIDGRVLGKPADLGEARKMLETLSGRTHTVLTAFTVIRPAGPPIHGLASTEVEFRRLRPEEIEAYLAGGSPLDKAGAYGIQDLGGGLVKAVRGSYTNVVGLPLAEVIEALAEAGVVSRQVKNPEEDIEPDSLKIG